MGKFTHYIKHTLLHLYVKSKDSTKTLKKLYAMQIQKSNHDEQKDSKTSHSINLIMTL